MGKTALMKKLKNDLKKNNLVIYMDLSAMDKFKKQSLTRFTFMKLYYESIIKACNESKIHTINTKIRKYFITNNFKLDKIENIDKIPYLFLKQKKIIASLLIL